MVEYSVEMGILKISHMTKEGFWIELESSLQIDIDAYRKVYPDYEFVNLDKMEEWDV